MASKGKPLTRFYSLREVADKAGTDYKELAKAIKKDDPYGIDTYRWSVGSGSRVYVTQNDANKILAAHDAPLMDDAPPLRQSSYGVIEVARILGLKSHMSVFNLAKDRLKNDISIPMELHDEVRFTTKKLVEGFGKDRVLGSNLDLNQPQAYHSLDDVAAQLRISKRGIQKMIENGSLVPVKTPQIAERLSISHDNLATWIETRKNAYADDKTGMRPREGALA